MAVHKPAFSYRLLSFLLFIFWVLHALWHALKQQQPGYFWQRLGLFSGKQKKQAVWIHAASVGEVELIRPLVEYLQKNYPIVVTTFTVTGFQHAIRTLPENVSVAALPIDLLPVSWSFMHRNNFKLALIAETELWPETLYQVRRKGIPLLQINARLSDKTLKASGWTQNLLKNTLGYFDQYLTRTQQDVNNLLLMGADRDKIIITGNLKYAHTPTGSSHERLILPPYILFASTHYPEEKLFAQLVKQLSLKQLIVIAPRHPQRAKEILQQIKPLGLDTAQRSSGEEITEHTQVYLADTLGELKSFMAYAQLVIMGGSFNDTGGHNVLEPARLGKAVITGPSDTNIQPDIALLLQHDAIIQVPNTDQLAHQIKHLLNDSVALQKLSENASKLMETQSHILGNYLNVINRYLA